MGTEVDINVEERITHGAQCVRLPVGGEVSTRLELLADGFVFPEGPRWHQGALWLSDMHGETVYRVSLDGQVENVLTLPGDKPSGLGFLPSGELLVVAMRARQILRHDVRHGATSTRVHADLSQLATHELNDMVVDGDGRAWVGTLHAEPEVGVLIRVDPDGTSAIAATRMQVPNGTVLTEDSRLIVTESKGRRYTSFDIEFDGELTGRRVLLEYPDAAGDGLALDAEGGLWSALPLGRAFIRLLPGVGVTHRIDMGDQMAVACALGGPDRRTLFLLSAPHWDAAELAGRREGRVEMLTVDVPGAGLP